MKIITLPIKEILDFEQEEGLELVVVEHEITFIPKGIPNKWTVSFANTLLLPHELEEINARGDRGYGMTIDKALEVYCIILNARKSISFSKIDERLRRIILPTLRHTKLLNR